MDQKEANEENLKEKSLNVSIAEGSAYSVMEGFGLRYVPPYAVALGMSNTFIGILGTLPGLIGSLVQIPGSRALEHRSRKRIVFTSVLLQALMWLPLIAVGFLYFVFGWSVLPISVLLLFFYVCLISFGAFASPAWNSWMRDLITKDTDYYFGKRNAIVGATGLVSLLIAGLILSYFQESNVLLGFSIIFFIAFIGRAVSAYFFTRQYEPSFSLKQDYYFSFLQFTKKMTVNNFGKFVIFSALITFATAIASPFFAVYMLKDLQFDYISYTIVTVASLISTLFFMPFWGKFGDKYGNVETMRLTGFFVFTIPLLWIATIFFNSHFGLLFYLIIIELFSGFIWAGFSLSSGTFAFHAVSKERLGICVAYNGIFSAIGGFLGAFLGGELSSAQFGLFGMSGLLFVFFLSAVLRLGIFLFFFRLVREVREVKKFEIQLKKIFTHLHPKQMSQSVGIKRVGFNEAAH